MTAHQRRRLPDNVGNVELPDQIVRISPRTYGRLAKFVTAELGIKMPESKVPMIQSRLMRRVRDLDLESLDAYCEYLFSPSGAETERVHFIDAVTTNKTEFFREPGHFTQLVETVLPHVTRSRAVAREKRISVWSAGCSSGEEAYTLAMLLGEYAAARPPLQFRILATDISTKTLQIARAGIYNKERIAPVPLALRRKYLLQSKSDPNLLRIRPVLRKCVSFHRLNFMADDYAAREMFDVIFCRNVLIYFDRPTQQAVIGKLCRNLSPHGYLFVSHSESLTGLDLPLVSVGSSCFRKHGA